MVIGPSYSVPITLKIVTSINMAGNRELITGVFPIYLPV
jgi:hypothetical protein